ncbi:MAG: hypothetical protein EPO26_10935 [Chloroflexota bacterium]|nr:MAG: hypothetical protein EPO26_10935 [Chloroflexota bacterium]
MGSYAELYVGAFQVWSWKSYVDRSGTSLFLESDRRVYERGGGDQPNRVVEPDHADEPETAHKYVATVRQIIDRLDIMGFTLPRVRQLFQRAKREQLAHYERMQFGFGWYQTDAAVLRRLTFGRWIEGARAVLTQDVAALSSPARLPNLRWFHTEGSAFGDPDAPDERFFLRALLEAATPDALVVLDYTDLVGSGYYDPAARLTWEPPPRPGGYLADDVIIILTEGTSDAALIAKSIALRYPHLAGYYRFPDFAAGKAPGGAAALVNTIKAFVAAGVRNPVIGLFDNDTAGKVALQALEPVHLPPNVQVRRLPDLKLARRYPRVGAQGSLTMNVNGRAAGVELYFGADVLRGPDGSLDPIEWGGQDRGSREYQGELRDKHAVQSRYSDLLDGIVAGSVDSSTHDWTGIDALCAMLFRVFSSDPPLPVRPRPRRARGWPESSSRSGRSVRGWH